jgi:N-acetyl-gamma-glutamyl-phosphate reductase
LRTTGLQIHQRLHGGTDLQLLTLAESDCKNPTRRSHQ